jgi:hypothetical protein
VNVMGMCWGIVDRLLDQGGIEAQIDSIEELFRLSDQSNHCRPSKSSDSRNAVQLI